MMNAFGKLVLTLVVLLPAIAISQHTIEPYTGYGIDLANKQPLSQVNIGLQYPVIGHKVYQLLIRVQGSLPLNTHSGTSIAYTPDQSLPLNITTGYKAKWYAAAFIIGNRFTLISWKDKNTISPFVNAGVVYQNIAVGYNSYNTEQYTVLNPHRSLKKLGLCIGAGIQYKRSLGSGAVFMQAECLSSPLVEDLNNYSYKLPVPLSINVGYVVELKKRSK